MKKTKRKIITISIIVLCLIILLGGVFLIYKNNKNTTPKEWKEDQIVAYGLNLYQIVSYAHYYDLNSEEFYEYEKDPSKDFNCKFEKTETTDKAIALINYFAWDHIGDNNDELQEQLDLQKILNKYGFTSQNRITADWVLNNPHEAYYLTKEAYEQSIESIFGDSAEQYDYYILGKGRE